MRYPFFDQFVRDHEEFAYALALSFTRDPEAAGDVVQDSFLKALRAWPQLRSPERLKPWLHTIVRNTAIDWSRRQKRAPLGLRGHESLPAPVLEEKPSMEQIIGRLRSDYREILLLRYVEGFSYAEIGKRVGLSPTAVGEKLWRARRFLRLRLGHPEAAIA